MPTFGGVSRSSSRYDQQEVAGFGEVTVALSVGVENERFSAALFVRNLFDTRYRAYGFTDSVGYDVAIAGERRLVGPT